MKNILFCLSVIIILSGCVSIPPQAVTSQELIMSGLVSAKKNQITIIDAYADDQISRIESLMKNTVIDDVIKAELKGREGLPADEVKTLLLEYAEDLRTKIAKVETKRHRLLLETNKAYDQLISLAKANHDFLRSAHNASTFQNKLLDKYKEKLKDVEDKINDYINE